MDLRISSCFLLSSCACRTNKQEEAYDCVISITRLGVQTSESYCVVREVTVSTTCSSSSMCWCDADNLKSARSKLEQVLQQTNDRCLNTNYAMNNKHARITNLFKHAIYGILNVWTGRNVISRDMSVVLLSNMRLFLKKYILWSKDSCIKIC
jgi:hypothetical protein